MTAPKVLGVETDANAPRDEISLWEKRWGGWAYSSEELRDDHPMHRRPRIAVYVLKEVLPECSWEEANTAWEAKMKAQDESAIPDAPTAGGDDA